MHHIIYFIFYGGSSFLLAIRTRFVYLSREKSAAEKLYNCISSVLKRPPSVRNRLTSSVIVDENQTDVMSLGSVGCTPCIPRFPHGTCIHTMYSRVPDCAKWYHVVILARLLVFPRTFYFITLLIWFCSHLPRDTTFHLLPGTVATVTICTDSDKVARWDLSVVWLWEVTGQLAAKVLWAFF